MRVKGVNDATTPRLVNEEKRGREERERGKKRTIGHKTNQGAKTNPNPA